VTENAALNTEPEQADSAVGRGAVISAGTWVAGGIMVLAVTLLATLDYLGSTGVLPGLKDATMAALTLVPLVVALIILPVARSMGEGGTVRTSWTLFGLAMLSIGVGNVIFLSLFAVTGKDPYPSIAEVFTLGGYALFAAAFAISLRAYRDFLDIRRPMIIAAAVSIAALVLVWFTVISPYVILAPAGTQTAAARFFNTLYLVLDAFVLLLPAIALGLLVSKLGKGRVAWGAWLVVAGAGTLAVTDTVFAYTGYIGAGRTPLVDSGYAVAPMLIALAAMVARDVYRS
jgi:hypothetical protein